MKRVFLGCFIFFDLALMAGSAFVLFAYISGKMPAPPLPLLRASAKPSSSAGETRTGSTTPVKAAGNVFTAPAGSTMTTTRKILFSYRNSHARQVSIRADFTGWKAEPMLKGANGNWTYQAQLTPGEYAYCYTADDKTFKDPANKRTKQIGRTPVSAIVVEALPSKPPK